MSNTNESPDVFYIDVLVNNISNNTVVAPPMSYNASRTLPYLYNPKDYYASCVQFSIDAPNLGIMTYEIVPNQPDVNLGIYEVALKYNDSIAYQSLMWQPQNTTTPVPLPPSLRPDKIQDTSTSYYTLYAYSYFNEILNTALVACYNQLLGMEPTLPPTMTMRMIFVSDTGLFDFYVEDQYFNQETNNNPIYVYFNGPLTNLYSYFVNSKVLLNGNTYYKFLFNNTSAYPDTNLNPVQLYMRQEGASLKLWSQNVSIVITSQSLPLYQSTIFSPLLYYNNLTLTPENNALNENIILEYMLPSTYYNEKITYEPLAQFQLIELNSSQPLFNFDLKYYIRDFLGRLRPIFLSSSSSSFTKIGFFKKSMYQRK